MKNRAALSAAIIQAAFAVMSLLISLRVLAADDSMQVHNKELVQRSFDAWRAGTGSPFDLLADDAEWTIVGKSVASKTYSSKQDFLGTVIRPFNARMLKPLVPTIRGIYADQSTVVIYFDADGTALDHRPYHNSYAWFFDFRGDRVVRAVAFFDSIEFNGFWTRVKPPAAGAASLGK